MSSSAAEKPTRQPRRPSSLVPTTAEEEASAATTPSAPEAPSDSTRSAEEPAPVLTTAVRILRAEPGIHTLHIAASGRETRQIAGVRVPAIHVGAPSGTGQGIEVIASFPQRGPWFGAEGGTAVINVPAEGGRILVTGYDAPGQPAVLPAIELRRLEPAEPAGVPGNAGESDGPAPAGAVLREVPTEILLHIERAGDRVFPGRGWVGALGRKLRIEAFSIRPLEGLLPADIEFKGLQANGQETPWVNAGALCGTRGRGMPLTGFAVRLAAHLRDRFDAVYEGSFFNAGIVGPHRNGEPCRSTAGNDPLEAVNIRLLEKGAPQQPAGC